jgi:hypothetical protein
VSALSQCFAAATLVAALGAGCSEVLSLEEAEVDPTLSEDPQEGESAEASLLCTRYCNMVMSHCSGLFSVYRTMESCLEVCGFLPEGEEGDEIGNTIHCRLRNAEVAPAEPPFYCPIAGPGGNGVCGANCEAMCLLGMGICVGDDAQWPSAVACRSDCAGLPDLGFYSTDPQHGMYEGAHVQCRLFHLSSATIEDTHVHCGHASGAPPCDGSDSD